MIKYSVFRNAFLKSSNLFSRFQAHSKLVSRNCCIRRALLYVPGNDTDKLNKALQLNLDCILMDCEDGVALNKKDEARNNIREFLDKGPVTAQNPEWGVRINPVQASELFEEDIKALLSAKNLPVSICLPKVNNVDQLQWFAEKVWNVLLQRSENDRGPLKLIMLIESAVAIMKLPDLCKKAEDLATMAPIQPVALILGSDDLLANIGATRTQSSIELLYARQKLVIVAKAFGLQAIDMVFLNYKDNKGFMENCADGVLLGFTGKQVIHPNQVLIAQEQFVPSRAKIHWAKSIVKEFQSHQQKGKGVFTFENNMIDMPTVRQAENILKVAEAAGQLDKI